ncbi:TonB-dependent receptor [Bacterioplanes sanyensis]|uniref:TonB-dependent receptor n=1 Tax=Bacterioplanes sanyensis TaxID=1249553 RepID=UPI0012FE10DF|nr:TonB-dependent receptor plug domain-containing protein [Bacterioplanes sanyensis]
MRHLIICTFLCALPTVTVANGQSLSPVVVTAENARDSNAREFDRAELEQGHSDLASFLGQLNGVQVQSTAAIGDPVMLSVQGADARQTQVLIDGIEAPRNEFGSYDLSTIPLAQIDSLALTTSGAVSSAIGGTLEINTRDVPVPQLQTGVGAYGLRQLAWQQPLSEQSHLQLHHLRSLNNFDYPVPSPIDAPNDRNQPQALNNADFQRYDLALQQRWSQLRLRLGHRTADKSYPDYFSNRDGQHARFQQQASSAQLSGHWHQYLPHQWQLYWRRFDDQYIDRGSAVGLGRQDNRYFGHQLTGQWRTQWNLQQLHSAFNIEAQQQRYVSRHRLSANAKTCDQLRASCDLLSKRQQLSAELQQRYLWEKQQLQWSVRHRQVDDSSLTRSGERIDDRWSWFDGAIGLQHTASDWHSQLSVKRAIRFASLYERFGDRGLLQPNPDLNNERAHSLHWDTHLTLPLMARLSAFYRWLDDAIVPVYDSRGIGRYENTDAARMTGVEWQLTPLQLHFNGLRLSTDLSGSHYHSQTDSDVKAFDQQRLPGIYHQQLRAQMSAKWHRQSLQLSFEYADDLYIDRANLIIGDQRRLWHLHYRYQANAWQAGTRLDNLSDQTYRDFSNRPARPRTWLAYLTLNY